MAGFNAQVASVRRLIHRNSRSYVKTIARRLVRRLAFNAGQAPRRYLGSGRLRAGFWPAAIALNISNIYTPYPNKNEGSVTDRTSSRNPSITITNSVPYILRLHKGTGWVNEAESGVRAQMARDLEKYARDSWAKRDLIDDLTAN